MNSVLIIAAEASSGLFAQRLMEHWQAEKRQISAFGVGTNKMEALGFARLGKAEDMAVVGAAEVIEHYGRLKKIFDEILMEAAKRKPQVAVLMDYPEFNLRLAKELHALGIPVVYYISPQIWAWRKGRVETIKKYCQKIFVLFPFEVDFYTSQNVPVEFVGHPLLDEMNAKFDDPQACLLQRRRRGIQDDDLVLGLMPGSRRNEIKMHFSLQLEVARKLLSKNPKLKVAILVAPTMKKEELMPYLDDIRFPYLMWQDESFEMISLTDLILVASGTATLQVGLLKKPMVIMYKLHWLTGYIAKIFVRGVKFFGLVNLILGHEAVPERWQEGANAKHLEELLQRYISEPDYRKAVIDDLAGLRTQLGDRGATARVARGLESYWTKS